MSRRKKQKQPSPDRRWLGSVFVTVLVGGIAAHDQITSGSVDDLVLGALVVIFAGWLGENLTELLDAWRGR